MRASWFEVEIPQSRAKRARASRTRDERCPCKPHCPAYPISPIWRGNPPHETTSNATRLGANSQPRYCILVEHPHEGLILWETGCGKDYPEVWGPVVSDIFSRVRYEPQHELRAAVEATGNKIEDIKKIIIGHLHLDHAGGLDEFLDRKDVEIWVHDRELRAAFWSVATGADVGVYLEHYLKLGL